ncbi:MAG: rhomboid family intramembrane serine protease [Planctomycetes bacterium]|nr:rhomboid family intramembrane serine protease [Planctomycetota bacterium]
MTETDPESRAFPTQSGVRPLHRPWITILFCLACIVVFLGLAVANRYDSWDTRVKFGYLPAHSIRGGAYGGLVTSAFVHFQAWHLLFNIYWLWRLGARMERSIGSIAFFAFYLMAATVSSSSQLAVSDTTGIGASGVGYAIFGFMWGARRRYPEFAEVVDDRIVRLFLLWAVLCVIATHLDVLSIGNAAHFSGLAFGLLVAGVLARRPVRVVASLGLLLFLAVTIAPVFWCPWSISWLSHRAYDAHADHEYEIALERYSQLLRRDPENAWAYLNRSFVYVSLGRLEEAAADHEKALELDPEIDDSW